VAGSGNGGQQTRNEEHEVWTVVCSVQAVRIAAHFDDLQNIFLTYFGTEPIHHKRNKSFQGTIVSNLKQCIP
jgi:hypothetical protein